MAKDINRIIIVWVIVGKHQVNKNYDNEKGASFLLLDIVALSRAPSVDFG